jgi:outer membrane protein assembly factor BamB
MLRNTPTLGPDGTLYVASLDFESHAEGPATSVARVSAVSSQDGKVLWQSRVLHGSVAPEASPVLGPGNTLLLPAENKLLAFDRKTGAEVWSVALGGRSGTPLVGPDNTIYAGSNGANQGGRHSVKAIRDGKVVWEFSLTASGTQHPELSLSPDGRLYVGDSGSSVSALDPATGHALWEARPGHDGAVSPTTGPDGIVYLAGGRDQQLYALDGRTGQTRWTFDARGELWRRPAVTEQEILVGSKDGKLHALAPESLLASKLPIEEARPQVTEADGFVLVGEVALRKRRT